LRIYYSVFGIALEDSNIS